MEKVCEPSPCLTLGFETILKVDFVDTVDDKWCLMGGCKFGRDLVDFGVVLGVAWWLGPTACPQSFTLF